MVISRFLDMRFNFLVVVLILFACSSESLPLEKCKDVRKVVDRFYSDFSIKGNVICTDARSSVIKLEMKDGGYIDAFTNLECARMVLYDILTESSFDNDSIMVFVSNTEYPKADAYYGVSRAGRKKFLDEEENLSESYRKAREYLLKERSPMDLYSYDVIFRLVPLADERLEIKGTENFWSGLRSYSQWKETSDASLELARYLIFLDFLKADTSSATSGSAVDMIFSAGKLTKEEL